MPLKSSSVCHSIAASHGLNPPPWGLRLQVAVVIVDVILIIPMPPTGGEVILLHFMIGSINAPTVNRHAIYGGHHARARPPPGAVDEDWPVGLIVDDLEETRRCVGLRVALLLHREVDVAHPSALCGGPGVIPGVLSQIHNRFNSERGQLLIVAALGLRAPVEVVVDFSEILYFDSGAAARSPLVIRNRAGRQRYCAYQSSGHSRCPYFMGKDLLSHLRLHRA